MCPVDCSGRDSAPLCVDVEEVVDEEESIELKDATTHEKGLVETFLDVVPTCEGGGPLYTITTTSNLVMHETVFDNGNVHATFTQTGTFSAAPLDAPRLPSFTGKFTVWGNFNQSGSVANGTSTFNLQGTGSDGSMLSNHSVEHFNVPPDGSVNGHGGAALPPRPADKSLGAALEAPPPAEELHPKASTLDR